VIFPGKGVLITDEQRQHQKAFHVFCDKKDFLQVRKVLRETYNSGKTDYPFNIKLQYSPPRDDMADPEAVEQFDLLSHKQFKRRRFSKLFQTKILKQEQVYKAQAAWGNNTMFDFLMDVRVSIPPPEGVAEGSRLFMSIGPTKDGCVGFLTAPCVEREASRFVKWGIYPYLHHAVTTYVMEECEKINEEAEEKNLNGGNAEVLDDLGMEALVDDAIFTLQRAFAHSKITLASFEEFRWNAARQTLTDVDSMNMGKVVVEFGHGLTDMHKEPGKQTPPTTRNRRPMRMMLQWSQVT
jgi:hypothetical protein